MGKSKRKKNKLGLDPPKSSEDGTISNLPEKFIHMNVKSGTKMRNVLEFAMKEFQNNDAILWTAAGEGIKKVISCVEIFRRKNPGLHQITKLGSIESKKSLEEKDKDGNTKIRYVAQINILLTREAFNKNSPNSDDTKMFWKSKSGSESKDENQQESGSGKLKRLAAEEFSGMVLSTRQKRSRNEQHTEEPLKKNKKKEGDNQ